jgi:hypothetical protein
MRNVARLKMGFYPLPEPEGVKLRSLLTFAGPASVIDPCVGHPEHFHKDSLRTTSAAVTRANDSTVYWLDLGNNASSGQYVLGQPLNAANRRSAARLRTVAKLYPEIVDAEAGEDPLPSCSAAEALEHQEPFINQVLATSALAMLARLFHYGILTHHGAFYNAQTGRMAALPADPRMWERMRRRDRRANAKH